jgi:pilus assembly protein CpaF
MSFDLILPFFPEELRELLLDPSISDLMINGTSGVLGRTIRLSQRAGFTQDVQHRI